jgi:uncharacterized membrane protein YbhN (UPF0104 family)
MPLPNALQSRAKIGLAVAKAFIGLGLLALLFRQIGTDAVTRVLAGTNIGQFLIACAFMAAGVAIQGLRWKIIADQLGAPLAIGAALVGMAESMFFNQILPSGVGGDALRAVRAYDEGARPGQAVLGVLLDRAFGLWFIAAVALFATIAGGSRILSSTPWHLMAAVSAIIFAGAVGAAVIGRLIRDRGLPKWLQPIGALLMAFATAVGNARLLLAVTGTMVASMLLFALSLDRCAAALSLSPTLWDITLVLQGMMLASIVPLSIGGWGWREGAAVLLFTAGGIGAAEAAGLSILFGLASTVLGLVGAVVWMGTGYRRFAWRDGLAAIRQVRPGDGPESRSG